MPIPILDPQMVAYRKYREKIKSLAYQKGTTVQVFTEELRRLCKMLGYNFPGLWIQAYHETDGFTSALWKSNTNPAGLKNASGNGYQRYYNGVDAARAFVTHMSSYAPPPQYGKRLEPYHYLDTRYDIAMAANKGKVYRSFHDLAGTWAEDPTYGKQIEEKYRYLLGE